MSAADGPKDKGPRPFRVPPIEHRFRKGVSGNPKGRPRKDRAFVTTQIDGKSTIAFEDRIKSLAIEEAYRLIAVRDGDRVQKMPAIQAILRKTTLAAANGDPGARQIILKLITGAEADRRTANAQMVGRAVEYKEFWNEELSRRARTGAKGPEPLPHPDDVIIEKDGTVRVEGPVTLEQKEARDRLREMWPDLTEESRELDQELASDPDNAKLRARRKELTAMNDLLLNDSMKRFLREAARQPAKKAQSAPARASAEDIPGKTRPN